MRFPISAGGTAKFSWSSANSSWGGADAAQPDCGCPSLALQIELTEPFKVTSGASG